MNLPRMLLNGIRFGVLALCFSVVLLVTGITAYSLISGQSLSDLLNLFDKQTDSAPSGEMSNLPEFPDSSEDSPFLDPSPSSIPSEVPITEYPVPTSTQYSLPSTSFLAQYLYTANPFTQIGGAIGGVLNFILDSFSINVKNFALNASDSIDLSGSLVDIGDGTYNRADGNKDLGVAGDFEARGSAEIAGTLYVGTDNGSGDDRIYFDDGASQYLMWDDDPGRFYFSNGIELAGDLRIGTGLIGNTDYLFFDDGKSQYLAWDDANDYFLLSNDLLPITDDAYDLGSSSKEWRNLYIDGTAYIDTLQADNLSLATGNITMPDESWIGLSATAGRLFFKDATTDSLSILTANFGIGTTNPAQKLHVEGQCVTGDTLLKRRKKKKKLEKGSGKLDGEGGSESDWEDVRIDEIQPGDEIQTLDEVTGALVTSTVKALMDMGKKDIVKLTTASGKTIRTTANHPYLIKTKEARKPKVGVFYDAANMYFAGKQAGWKLDFNKLRSLLEKAVDLSFFNLYVAMPRKEDADYRGTLNFLSKVGKGITVKKKDLKYIKVAGEIVRKGDVDVEIVLDVARNIDNLDLAAVVSGDSDFLELVTFVEKEKGKQVAFVGFKRNMAWELRLKRHLFIEKFKEVLDLNGKKNPDLSVGATLTRLLYQDVASLSRGKWTKVKEARVGDRIAVSGKFSRAVFEEITKIEHLPIEQVWDIEVEGTHNFVGNGIIAHNTYISGNLGIGTTNPGYKLEVNGSGLFTTLGVGATSPLYALYTSGNMGVGGTSYFASNVGIGTTLPDSKLHIVGGDLYVASDTPAFGNASAGEDLYVQGNLEVDGTLYTAAQAIAGNLGNLTSQFFANVYLNELDQFVKRVLRVPFYFRYADDLVLLAEDVDTLYGWRDEISDFLGRKLFLRLHPRKQVFS